MNQPNHWHLTGGLRDPGECRKCDEERKAMSDVHVGRSFEGHKLEDGCPCPKEPCGLIDMRKIVSACPEHAWKAGKTLRQSHLATDCPGKSE